MYQNQRRYRPNNRKQANRSATRRRASRIDASLFVKKATGREQKEYIPKYRFSDFPFCDELKHNISLRGYNMPTPIQDQAIPELLIGKDLVGIANTGTGKTAAFLLPLIQTVYTDRSKKVLIIAPTRELASQIEEEFRLFTRTMRLFSALCIGGASLGRQLFTLRRDPNFVIGTPGRLIDLERQGGMKFSTFTHIVLDEVDRMLDMGFIRDITAIISKLPTPRQSLFFSATVPEAVRPLMHTFLVNPVTIFLKAQDTSEYVNQDVIRMNGKPKLEMLHDLLVQTGFDKVLLFGRTKWGIEKLSQELEKRGFRVAAIHGNKRQSQRERALAEFKNNRIQVLLATDIASRGIDVSGVTHVINYDMPESYEDYVHRIGRTGRANTYGNALTFID